MKLNIHLTIYLKYIMTIKKYTEEMNLEEFVKDSVFVKMLIENHIPYKCKWKEKECDEQYPRWYKSRVRMHFFVFIYIPENYKTKCQTIFYSNTEKQLEDIENEKEEEKVVYEPIEKAKKVYMLIVKLIFLIAVFAVIYGIINSN